MSAAPDPTPLVSSGDDPDLYDVAIVGGGPAGLTAALWLGRYLRRVVIVDSGDPRNWETRAVNGFLGQPKVRPAELRQIGREECRKYDVTLLDGFVTQARQEHDDRFELEYDPMESTKATEDRRGPGTLRTPEDNAPRAGTRKVAARRLLLAFGLKDVWPRIPGLQQVYGDAAHVCPDCDGYETQGKRVLVIAKGRKAAGLALAVANWTPDIVVCTNGESADMDEELTTKLAGLGIPVLTDRVVCVHHAGSGIDTVEISDGSQLDVDKIFFAIAQRPADDLDAQLGCERDDESHVVIDAHFHTSVRNVFAAGDIVPGSQLAIAAAADGALAALSIHRSLVPDERKLKKRGVGRPVREQAAGA